jgi:hypothetical protein
MMRQTSRYPEYSKDFNSKKNSEEAEIMDF